MLCLSHGGRLSSQRSLPSASACIPRLHGKHARPNAMITTAASRMNTHLVHGCNRLLSGPALAHPLIRIIRCCIHSCVRAAGGGACQRARKHPGRQHHHQAVPPNRPGARCRACCYRPWQHSHIGSSAPCPGRV